MIPINKLAFFSILFYSVNAHFSGINAVQDAKSQAHKLLRCWEPADIRNPNTDFVISKPLYKFCSYMPDSNDYNKIFVNGVDDNSDDYSNLFKVYNDVEPAHTVLNVCLQEAFALHGQNSPAQISLRCLCKRDGCNLPTNLTSFLDYNKKAIPDTF